jgi:hypothetical protein
MTVPGRLAKNKWLSIFVDQPQTAAWAAQEAIVQMVWPTTRRLPQGAQLGPIPGDDVPLG